MSLAGAVDNAVAQIENDKVEASIVMGGDGGLNLLIVQPEITAIEQLKGIPARAGTVTDQLKKVPASAGTVTANATGTRNVRPMRSQSG
mgnify:CR=1 FL=1